MYLSNIKLWNFRKFGASGDINLSHPNLDLSFTKGMNVLIGENDSGKTAIIDAIKMVLKTHAYERIMWADEDFHVGSNEIRIELLIDGLANNEAAHFTEWLGWKDTNPKQPILRLIQTVRRLEERIIPQDLKAGMDEAGNSMDSEAREYLKVTFLKPLRDAESELTAKKYSRLSQILESHVLFKKGAAGRTELEGYITRANEQIKNWFKIDTAPNGQKSIKKQIKGVIDDFLKCFIDSNSEASFSITAGTQIKDILEKMSLHLDGITNPGLGSMNRLYMAAELLHLQKDNWTGLKLCLVEEEEAHLHPQAQMKVLETIQNHDTQFIITTHSPNLASKVELYKEDMNQIVICKGGEVFPMGPDYTMLEKEDYVFIDHFLDVSKANLFFAKGLILVEGWAEEIMLPALAKKMKMDLTSNEVSIVNVGSTAYMRYAKIFMRKDKKPMGCKVSIVTDLDVRPKDDGSFVEAEESSAFADIISHVDVAEYQDLKWNVAKRWTLEWCLFKSTMLKGLFMESAAKVHSSTFKNSGSIVDQSEFEQKLMDMLRGYKVLQNGQHESVSRFKKVEVAYYMAKLISEATDLDFNQIGEDDYAMYLKDAIKHACGK